MTAYKDRPPTPAEVQAHAEAHPGGGWMAWIAGWLPAVVRFRTDGGISFVDNDTVATGQSWVYRRDVCWRPCSADGTPVPWPGEGTAPETSTTNSALFATADLDGSALPLVEPAQSFRLSAPDGEGWWWLAWPDGSCIAVAVDLWDGVLWARTGAPDRPVTWDGFAGSTWVRLREPEKETING